MYTNNLLLILRCLLFEFGGILNTNKKFAIIIFQQGEILINPDIDIRVCFSILHIRMLCTYICNFVLNHICGSVDVSSCNMGLGASAACYTQSFAFRTAGFTARN